MVKVKEIEFLEKNKFRVVLTEGKKRQIRRMFTEIGFRVKDLKRTGIGKLTLENLKEGEWGHLSEKEVTNLLNN